MKRVEATLEKGPVREYVVTVKSRFVEADTNDAVHAPVVHLVFLTIDEAAGTTLVPDGMTRNASGE